MKFFLRVLWIFVGLGQAQAAPLRVVTSFSILKDLVEQVGKEHVEVSTLVGPDADAHVFEPTPDTSKQLLGAELLFINGLGFEGWMERLQSASGFAGPLCVASHGVASRRLSQDRKTVDDPHAWLSVPHVRVYVQNIQGALCAADPGHCVAYQKNARDYDAQLVILDTWIRQSLAPIPQEKRLVITAHDAFSYFAKSYHVRVLAPMGISTQSEPSAWDVAALINQIKELGIKTLFVENMANPKMMEQMAEETGARLGETLYSDALSQPQGPAPTYLALMRHNVGLLTKAMEAALP